MDVIIKAALPTPITTQNIIESILTSRGLVTHKEQEDFLNPAEVNLDYIYKYSGITKTSLDSGKSLLDQHLNSSHDRGGLEAGLGPLHLRSLHYSLKS